MAAEQSLSRYWNQGSFVLFFNEASLPHTSTYRPRKWYCSSMTFLSTYFCSKICQVQSYYHCRHSVLFSSLHWRNNIFFYSKGFNALKNQSMILTNSDLLSNIVLCSPPFSFLGHLLRVLTYPSSPCGLLACSLWQCFYRISLCPRGSLDFLDVIFSIVL